MSHVDIQAMRYLVRKPLSSSCGGIFFFPLFLGLRSSFLLVVVFTSPFPFLLLSVFFISVYFGLNLYRDLGYVPIVHYPVVLLVQRLSIPENLYAPHCTRYKTISIPRTLYINHTTHTNSSKPKPHYRPPYCKKDNKG